MVLLYFDTHTQKKCMSSRHSHSLNGIRWEDFAWGTSKSGMTHTKTHLCSLKNGLFLCFQSHSIHLDCVVASVLNGIFHQIIQAAHDEALN